MYNMFKNGFPKLSRDTHAVSSWCLVKTDPLLSTSRYQVADLHERADVDVTCIRKSTRQPTVPPNRRRAPYQKGQMGTYYMNLSPGTNA